MLIFRLRIRLSFVTIILKFDFVAFVIGTTLLVAVLAATVVPVVGCSADYSAAGLARLRKESSSAAPRLRASNAELAARRRV